MIWLAIAALSLLAVLFVLMPLIRRKEDEISENEITSSVLMDQLNELERDKNSGLISENEANAAKLEIKRRIVSSASRNSKAKTAASAKGTAVLVICALMVPAMAIGYYVLMGSPGLPGMAFADREGERQEAQKITALTEQLLERLENDPQGDNSEGWQLLARTYMRLGRVEEAVLALEKAIEGEGRTSASWSMLAEALVRVDQGIVSPRTEKAIEKALELNPGNPAATFYKALALSQAGRDRDAYEIVVQRLKAAETFAPWMDSLIAQANRLGKPIGEPPVSVSDFVVVEQAGPTAADVAAAQELNEEDRSQFIRSMVERLAERLKTQPDDLDGWMRLANAYTVIGERAEAIAAYKRADFLLGDATQDDPRHLKVEQALADLVK